MQLIHIAGYKFISLAQLPELQQQFLEKLKELNLKGTILLSTEGLNLSLAGHSESIQLFQAFLQLDSRFADLTYRQSFSDIPPYKRLKVKIKNEIITFWHPEVSPELSPAPSLSPIEFKQWLDENREITVLDTRNEYEIEVGTFHAAVNLHLSEFTEFPEAVKEVSKEKPIVMFCTGGVRCEKAAIHLLNEGFKNVYQLEGGILNYFAEVGNAHYDGDCFVFDERVAVNADLQQHQSV